MAYFVGTDTAETYNGTPEDDVAYLLGGNDLAYGSGGDDMLDGGSDDDRLFGDDGDDRLYGGSGGDRLFGGAGQDFLYGGSGDDVLAGGLGTNFLYGGDGFDIVRYTDVSSAVTVDLATGKTSGGDGSETLQSIEGVNGSAFDDIIAGNELANRLRGLDGNDTLDGRAGADLMEGGAGNDTYYVDNVGDEVIERAASGNDTIVTTTDYTLSSAQDIETLKASGKSGVDLTGNSFDNYLIGWASAVLRGGKGNDRIDGSGSLRGGDGNDILRDGYANDRLNGDNGDDTLDGAGDGNDKLAGGNGDDTLTAGYGADSLVGGTGIDTFVFNFLDRKIDTIKDFDVTEEMIVLRYFSGLTHGPLTQFSANFAVGTGAQIIYNETSGGLTYDHNGTLPGFSVQFATLSDAPHVTAANFTVV